MQREEGSNEQRGRQESSSNHNNRVAARGRWCAATEHHPQWPVPYSPAAGPASTVGRRGGPTVVDSRVRRSDAVVPVPIENNASTSSIIIAIVAGEPFMQQDYSIR